jgi:uncharacterized protein with GYD domain
MKKVETEAESLTIRPSIQDKKEKELVMATFISLVNLTEKGAQGFKASPERAAKFKAMAQKVGVTLKEVYWTIGIYDVVLILEGPDDATVAAALISLASLGNVRTQTLRGFNASEMKEIISKVPQ